MREIAGRGRSDNRSRDTGKVCWIVGRRVEKLSRRQHCVVGRHNWEGHTGTLGNRPLKKQGIRKDAADNENSVEDKGDEGQDTGRRGRRRKSQGKKKMKDDGSVRNEIMKSISRREEPILFV